MAESKKLLTLYRTKHSFQQMFKLICQTFQSLISMIAACPNHCETLKTLTEMSTGTFFWLAY
jgi:hypothetical protein